MHNQSTQEYARKLVRLNVKISKNQQWQLPIVCKDRKVLANSSKPEKYVLNRANSKRLAVPSR